MIPDKKIDVNQSETQLIINALNFLATNLEFKNKYFVIEDELLLIARKLSKQINHRINLSKPQGIYDITRGWELSQKIKTLLPVMKERKSCLKISLNFDTLS